ncbi:MAG: tetratricopeptide repeat protein [bacterium]|nr:tetratricopeptide repeat protein [bacterium]
MLKTMALIITVLTMFIPAFGTDIDKADIEDKEEFMEALTLYREGLDLEESGSVKSARYKYDRAVRLYPNFPDAQYGLGRVDIQLGYYEEAIEALTKVLELEPGRSEVRGDLGTAYYAMEDYSKASGELNGALRDDPDDTVAMYMLAKTHWKLGNYDKALKYYEETLKKEPSNIDCYYDMGIVAEEMGDDDKAVEYFNAFITVAANDPAQEEWVQRARKYIAEIKGEL